MFVTLVALRMLRHVAALHTSCAYALRKTSTRARATKFYLCYAVFVFVFVIHLPVSFGKFIYWTNLDINTVPVISKTFIEITNNKVKSVF